MVMYAPLIERYTSMNPPYSECKDGIKILFYEGQKEPVATISAKYANHLRTRIFGN